MLPGGRFLYSAVSDPTENTGIFAAALTKPSERVHLLAANSNALYAPSPDGTDYLLWQRSGELVAQEFDVVSLKMQGEPQLVASRVGVFFSAMIAGVSANGSLIYSPAP